MLIMNKGKSIRTLLAVFAILFIATTGCYEPSDTETFDKGDRVVVIEGKVAFLDSTSTVIVSRTVDATDTVDCEFIDNALVYLRDDNGNSAQLEYVGNGIYQTNEIEGQIGNSYLLTVDVEGERYSAIDKMPNQIFIDSVLVEYQDSYTIFDTIGYYVSIFSTRNADTLQYYRIEVERNGEKLDDYSNLWLFEDSHLTESFKMVIPQKFDVGDNVVVDVYSLSSNVYEYFSGLSKQFTTNFSNIQPPLTNPETNIRPTALGCFQASSVARVEIEIKEANSSVDMTFIP